MDDEGGHPGDGALPDHHGQGPAGAQLTAHRGDGCHAGGIEQGEHQQRGGGQGGEGGGDAAGEQNLQRGNHALLGHEAGEEGGDDPPVTQPQRMQQRCDDAGEHGQDAVVGVGHQIEVDVKALEEPHHDSGEENHREGPLQEVLGLVPQEARHILGAGEAVVGQLHDKGDRLAAEQRALK